jgi:hypothetical protein
MALPMPSTFHCKTQRPWLTQPPCPRLLTGFTSGSLTAYSSSIRQGPPRSGPSTQVVCGTGPYSNGRSKERDRCDASSCRKGKSGCEPSPRDRRAQEGASPGSQPWVEVGGKPQLQHHGHLQGQHPPTPAIPRIWGNRTNPTSTPGGALSTRWRSLV